MRNFKTEGIVIKRRNYGEADRMLTVFTRQHGKLSIKASGVRRIASRRSPHVELLNHTMLNLYKGQHLPVLTEAQTIDSYSGIKNDLTRCGFAYHICELVDGLCPDHMENETVFHILKNVLTRLATDEDLVTVIHEFEIELLTTLGYWNKDKFTAQNINTKYFIENLLERKLKARSIFEKIS